MIAAALIDRSSVTHGGHLNALWQILDGLKDVGTNFGIDFAHLAISGQNGGQHETRRILDV